jgi:hypothetical protein
MNQKFTWGSIAISLLLSLVALVGGNQSAPGLIGGVTNFDALETENLKVGVGCDNEGENCTGSSINGIINGSCTVWAPATTIAATSTQQIVCQSATNGSLSSGLTGVTADSICTLTMASSTNTTVGGLVVGGASASSTAGNIVARLLNLTGTTFTWTDTASSSAQWRYSCFDPA